MTLKVKEVADLVGISVRALHHYNDIGLLIPGELTSSGYRLYSDENLVTLQQILFFKELGLPLMKIKEMINSPSFDRLEAIDLQLKMLLEKRSRLDKMISTIDKTAKYMKGEIEMSNKVKFEGFDFSQNPYEKEARDSFGDEAVNTSNAKIGKMSENEQKAMGEKMNAIYRKLADLRDGSHDSEEAQNAINDWYVFINSSFGYHYSLDAFKGLSKMYVDDERFTKNIDQFGEGLAKFMCDAMAVYSDTFKK
ncbi:MerR family transcriptional regulator [Bacillus sp. DJP31]|uniref:MerR family transcriptional regulator n=1 Tax=Bacillus sp. DJP31 TaxID=3409789 RepID=UPI003BB50312